MPLHIETFILGPIENNVYLLSDSSTREAVLIDPTSPSREIFDYLKTYELHLSQIWITHAHFDHIGGVNWFLEKMNGHAKGYLHEDAIDLWNDGGSARDFGFDFDAGPLPEIILHDGDILTVGGNTFIALHTPGHSHGHITFYCESDSIAFCGDLIFYHGVGRTDLSVSNESKLLSSIQEKIFTLPAKTILYPGHGRFTTVGEEKENNPFI